MHQHPWGAALHKMSLKGMSGIIPDASGEPWCAFISTKTLISVSIITSNAATDYRIKCRHFG
jgi:hypothetical protein